jgi:hypothetical protein
MPVSVGVHRASHRRLTQAGIAPIRGFDSPPIRKTFPLLGAKGPTIFSWSEAFGAERAGRFNATFLDAEFVESVGGEPFGDDGEVIAAVDAQRVDIGEQAPARRSQR